MASGLISSVWIEPSIKRERERENKNIYYRNIIGKKSFIERTLLSSSEGISYLDISDENGSILTLLEFLEVLLRHPMLYRIA